MRISPKPVTSSTTPETAASKPSGGGSFLDILIQGTQDVHEAKPAGQQAQSDGHSDEPGSDDASSQKPSAQQAAQSGNLPEATSQKQTAPATNASATSASANQPTAQPAAGNAQSKTVQDLTSLLTLANLTAAANGASAAATVAQASTSSPNQIASSGKQSGAAKGTQGKQPATTATGADASALQQAAAIVQQAIGVPAISAPQPTLQLTLNPGSSQTGLTDLTTGGAGQSSQQADGKPSTASLPAVAASAASSNAQGQQDGSGVSGQFLHDLATTAAAALKASAPGSTTDASNSAQVAAQPAQSSDQVSAQAAANQPAASTFFSAALAQNDNLATLTASKATPFRIAATNFGTNANSNGVGAAGASTTAGANAVGSTSSKNNTQDSSNSSARDGQAGSNSALSAQTDGTQIQNAVRTDASAQPFALSAATAHATTQAGSSTSTADATPAHASEPRNLPAEPANASLPGAGSAINTARVIQNMNETEMRVGMRSAEFGDISIRTMVTQQQMQTQISVDHSELVSALTAHIPSVQAKLGADYGLHASIEVSQGGASFSNNQGQSSQRDYKPFTPSMQMDGTAQLAETDRIITRPAALSPVLEGSRLDIRA